MTKIELLIWMVDLYCQGYKEKSISHIIRGFLLDKYKSDQAEKVEWFNIKKDQFLKRIKELKDSGNTDTEIKGKLIEDYKAFDDYIFKPATNPQKTKLSESQNPKDSYKTLYCRYCGGKIYEDAVVCPHCGRQVGELTTNKYVDEPSESSWDGSNMTGLVIGTILFPIIGIIAGIYGLIKPGKVGQGVTLLILTIFVSIIWSLMLNGCAF